MHTINHKRLIKIIKNFKKTKILVVGDVMLDEFIWGKVTRISPEAPVPVVKVHHETMMPGGAANVARNINAVNGKAVICGVTGDDIRGRHLDKLLKDEGVGAEGLLRLKNSTTIQKTRVIAHSQQVVRIDREKDSLPAEKDIKSLISFIKKEIDSVDGVVIEDYGKGVITQDLVYFLTDICSKKINQLWSIRRRDMLSIIQV